MMRTTRTPWISVVGILVLSLTGSVHGQTGSSFTVDQAAEFVKGHNDVRQAAGVKVDVSWDKEVASFAQAWANELAKNGQFKHRPRDGQWKQKYGENLWAGSATFHKVGQAVGAWASEKKDYNDEPISQTNFLKVGHYTQMIWDRSTKIGAGVAIDKKNNRIIVVCNYSPPGNTLGQKPVSGATGVAPPKGDPPKIGGGNGISKIFAGGLTNDVRTKEYPVKMEKGQPYTINLTSKQFDTYLRVFDNNGNQIAKDDDGGNGLNSMLVFTPKQTGIYKLVVDSFAKQGKGSYALSVAGKGIGGQGNPAAGLQTFNGVLDATNPTKTYQINIKKGISYTINLTSGQFDTYLRVFDANGIQVAKDDDGGAGLNSMLIFSTQKPGVYKVVVDSFGGQGRGTYTLTIRSGAGGGAKALNPPQNLNGALNATTRKIPFRINMKQGVSYTIELNSLQFDTYLRILNSDGKQIAFDDDGGMGLNSRLVFTPPQAGVYTILVDSFAGQGEGNFNLKITASGN